MCVCVRVRVRVYVVSLLDREEHRPRPCTACKVSMSYCSQCSTRIQLPLDHDGDPPFCSMAKRHCLVAAELASLAPPRLLDLSPGLPRAARVRALSPPALVLGCCSAYPFCFAVAPLWGRKAQRGQNRAPTRTQRCGGASFTPA